MVQGQPPPWPRAVIVPSLAAARLALAHAPAEGLAFLAPPWMLAAGGVGFMTALLAALRPERPGLPRALLLDPGPAPGLALAALRAARGLPERAGLVLNRDLPCFASLSAATHEAGIEYLDTAPDAFSLIGSNIASAGTKRAIDRWFRLSAP